MLVLGEITAFTISGTAASGDAQYFTMTPTNVAFNASFLPRITGGAYNPEIVDGGTDIKLDINS